MKLRFGINQAEAFRRGIDATSSTATIEVDPSKLPQDTRNLIADRLLGIDVCELRLEDGARVKGWDRADDSPIRVQAAMATFEALLEAVKADEARIAAEETKAQRTIDGKALGIY